MKAVDFMDVFKARGVTDPWVYQKKVNELACNNVFPIILDVETGGGKTLAVLASALSNDKSIVLIEPTISLIDDLRLRIEGIMRNLAKMKGHPFSCIIDVGLEKTKTVLQPIGEKRELEGHFYDSDVVITTYDSFVYRMLGYGKWRFAYLFPIRIKENFWVCFDECHSLDKVGYTIFITLLRKLKEMHVGTYVMSATLPPELKRKLKRDLSARLVEGKAFRKLPSGETLDKYITYFSKEGVEELAEWIKKDEKTIVCLPYIYEAWNFYTKWIDKYGKNLFFYHGRLLRESRRGRYRKLTELEKKGEGYLLVTTHAIKEGCDLNADLMLLKIPDPFSLIQLMGRVRRFPSKNRGLIYVFGDYKEDFLEKNEKAKYVKPRKYQKLLKELRGGQRKVDDKLIERLRSLMKNTPSTDRRLQNHIELIHKFVYDKNTDYENAWFVGIPYTRESPPRIDVLFVPSVEEQLEYILSMNRQEEPESYDGIERLLVTDIRLFRMREKERIGDFIFVLNEKGRWKIISNLDMHDEIGEDHSLYATSMKLFLGTKWLISRGLVFPPTIFDFTKWRNHVKMFVDGNYVGYYSEIS